MPFWSAELKRRALILIIMWICSGSAAVAGVGEIERFFIDKHGDLILGGLFPLHQRGVNENECGRFQSMPGYQYMEAMLFAINEINNDTSLLGNVTLGARIYDTCHSQTIGAKMTKELISLTLVPPDSGAQLAGVIGSHSSDLSKVVADFLRVFEIPQISYGSTATTLSDKTIYSYFFRTVPPDSWQATAMADIVDKLNWNYVIAINSNGLYGEKGIEEFYEAAKKLEICIALRHSLSSFPSEKEIDSLVADMNNEPRARAVVLFTVHRDSRLILQALQRNPSSKRFYWIASDSWGNNKDIAEGLEYWAEGAVTLSQLNEPVKGFDGYFRGLSVNDTQQANNTWLRHFWQSHFKCSLSTSSVQLPHCSGRESLLNEQITYPPVRTVVNAVYAIAHALDDFIKSHCAGTFSACRNPLERHVLVEYLKNATFKDQGTGERLSFDKHQEIMGSYSVFSFQNVRGKYTYRSAGFWRGPGTQDPRFELNMSVLKWPGNGSTPPLSLCSDTCPPGHIRLKKSGHDIACCWDCFKCMPRDIIENNTCNRCPFGHSPKASLLECVKLPVVNTMSRSSSVGILALSVLGLVCVAMVSIIFFRHSDVPLIKASSRELSGLILTGLALLFIFPWFLLTEPSRFICAFQPVLLGVALASCYAPLFMKILRILRIFNSARKSAGKPILISPASQVLIAVALIMIQFLFSIISFFPSLPVPQEREVSDGREIFIECSIEKDVFASLLSYNMLLMALCTIMAFKTRKFPRNFNEAKFIGFTMYFTCFVWIIFFPFYLSSGNGLRRVNWEASAVLLIGWITLLGLFAPKIALLFLGGEIASNDQLAMTTTNTISQAAVVRVDNSEKPTAGSHCTTDKNDQEDEVNSCNSTRC